MTGKKRVDRKAPAKRSQHANATYPNIVGHNMLCAFGHRVAMCCDMLGVVGSTLEIVKFEPTTPSTIVWPGLKCTTPYESLLKWHTVRRNTIQKLVHKNTWQTIQSLYN